MSSVSVHGGEALAVGNYKLNKFVMHSLVNGSEVNMSSMFRYIEIYEDLFSPYITAKVFVEDGHNFPERFPITGQEKVTISFKTDIDSFQPLELTFRVYKLDAVKLSPNGKSQNYVLHLMSDGGYFNFSETCGYALSGSVSDMVYTVFKKHFPESLWKNRLVVQQTKDNYSFVLSNFYTPFKAISWLATKAFSGVGKEFSPFLFYETLDGHRFQSISKIIENGSTKPITYLYTAPNIGTVSGVKQELGFSSVLPSRYHKIQMLEELNRFDMADNIMSGIISSKLLVHDLLRKEVRESEFFESDVFDSMKKLGTNGHFRREDPDAGRLLSKGAAYFYMPSTGYTVHTKNNPIEDNFKTETLRLNRNYHLNTFLTQKLIVQVFGDSRRRVGDIVIIRVPKPQSDVTSLDDQDDKNLAGEYMITTIKHTLATSYSCKYELSRNCMGV